MELLLEIPNLEPQILLQCLSDVVRSRREHLGLSQEELGVRAGLHRTYISDVECGARNLSLKTLCRLSSALQVVPSDLIRDAELKTDTVEDLDGYYNLVGCGLYSMDDDGNILRVNETFLKWLGYLRKDVVGTLNIRSLIEPSCLNKIETFLSDLVKNGEIRPSQIMFVKKNGESLSLIFSAKVAADAAGHMLFNQVTLLDLSAVMSGLKQVK